ncbi:MAG: GAF domain-containing protein [Acidobacteriaceae bacterium]|nr:GAF domain-containing protein [Acidobacteriaceae bacterium]
MKFLNRQQPDLKTRIYGFDPVEEHNTPETQAGQPEKVQPRIDGPVRSQATSHLNQAARRFRQYESEAGWVAAVMDGAAHFAGQIVLFAVEGEKLRVRGQRNLNLPDDLIFPQASGRAFLTAIRSKDPVVALRTPGEVSNFLSGNAGSDRAHVLPVLNGERVVALLFAGDGELDLDALELISGMASMALERQSNALHSVQIAAVQKSVDVASAVDRPEPASAVRVPAKLPPWSSLSEEQRTLHIRAQRFSRTKVAEMQLSRPEACRAGFEQNNVYLFLKKEIDAARESYRTQFLAARSMVDYLHMELVRTAGGDDESKLGADYPGQLV